MRAEAPPASGALRRSRECSAAFSTRRTRRRFPHAGWVLCRCGRRWCVEMADAGSAGGALGSARPRLALLIPTLVGREQCLARLLAVLEPQVRGRADQVFIALRKDDGCEPTGSKRNALLDEARSRGATHVAFIDDDDLVSPRYVSLHLPGVRDMYDCNSLRGLRYIDGTLDRPFEHSLRHAHWREDEHCY